MGNWTFLTNHARVLLCIARDPGARLRDISALLGITERSSYAIVTDLTQAGYVSKVKDGRRNRYRIRSDLPLPEAAGRQATIGELLGLRAGTGEGAGPATQAPGRRSFSATPMSWPHPPGRPSAMPRTRSARSARPSYG